MRIGKMIIDAAHLYQNLDDEKSYIPVTFYKIEGNTGGKIYPGDNDMHLDMKFDYTVSRELFQKCHSLN